MSIFHFIGAVAAIGLLVRLKPTGAHKPLLHDGLDEDDFDPRECSQTADAMARARMEPVMGLTARRTQ